MVEKFQCPGCVAGSDTGCGNFTPNTAYGASCKGHVLGTSIGAPGNSIALGLPRGFNKPGPNDGMTAMRNTMEIRLWTKGEQPEWDHLNVPVWAMERDGYLFVRTYMPRTNRGLVDVIKGGAMDVVGDKAINVSVFVDEID